MEIRDKVILADVDGVLFDWEYHFYKWLKENYDMERVTSDYCVGHSLGLTKKDGHKYVHKFNNSGDIKCLSPYKDAIKYVRKLHEEHGYIFHVISSMSDKLLTQNWRTQNLIDVFGNVFDGFEFLSMGSGKDIALAKWEGTECFWIEDKEENVKTGNKFGLVGILMAHEHNRDCFDETRVKNWKEIYDIITGGL